MTTHSENSTSTQATDTTDSTTKSKIMATSTSTPAALDQDTATLRARIATLRNRQSLLSSTLLSNPHTRTRLLRAKAASPSVAKPKKLDRAISTLDKHDRAQTTTLYRTTSSITSFLVQDPSPNALDGGRVLGVRIDVFEGGKSIPPYYLLLNKCNPGSPHIRVHKHTLPGWVPLVELCGKYLPQPSDKDEVKQNLPRLCREVRKLLAEWHSRLASVEKMRNDAGLQQTAEGWKGHYPLGRKRKASPAFDGESEGDEEDPSRTEDGCTDSAPCGPGDITAIKTPDGTARTVEITWRDGSIGVIRIISNGSIAQAVVYRSRPTDEGSRRNLRWEIKILGGDRHMSGVVQRLKA